MSAISRAKFAQASVSTEISEKSGLAAAPLLTNTRSFPFAATTKSKSPSPLTSTASGDAFSAKVALSPSFPASGEVKSSA